MLAIPLQADMQIRTLEGKILDLLTANIKELHKCILAFHYQQVETDMFARESCTERYKPDFAYAKKLLDSLHPDQKHL